MNHQHDAVLAAIRKKKLVAILRGVPEEKLDGVVDALIRGGIRILEFTFDHTSEADVQKNAEKIHHTVEVYGDQVLVGCGTALTIDEVEATCQAGGCLVITPNTNEAVIHRTRELGMVAMPGALTPTEIEIAWRAGADIVKLFPAGELGLGYIKVPECGHHHGAHHHDHGEDEHHHEHHHHDHGECEHHHEHHHHDHGECEHHHEHHHHDHGECEHHHDHHHHDNGEDGPHHDHHHHDCGCGHDHAGHHHADEVFTSWGRETIHVYSEEQVGEILKSLENEEEYGDILRAKGMVKGEDGTWIYFDMVPGEYEVRTGAPEYTGRICVIGAKINEEKLEKLFGL